MIQSKAISVILQQGERKNADLENQEPFALAGKLGVQECSLAKWQYAELLGIAGIMHFSPYCRHTHPFSWTPYPYGIIHMAP